MTRKTILLASVFLSGSVLAAVAQSSSPSSPSAGFGTISPATHCLDQATGQPKLKTAASGSASGSGSASTLSPSTSGSAGGSTGMSGSSSTGSSSSSSP